MLFGLSKLLRQPTISVSWIVETRHLQLPKITFIHPVIKRPCLKINAIDIHQTIKFYFPFQKSS
jgi:hypothetical protein